MDNPDLDRIRALAIRFRHAIENCGLSILPGALGSFPCGSCREASQFLGAYFKDQGVGVFALVSGYRESMGLYHAWLRQGSVIADIAADQFEEISEKVIVPVDSVWHESFDKVTILHDDADFRTLPSDRERNARIGEEMESAYHLISSLADVD